MSRLPPEILFSIFHRAIPPYPLLDTTLTRGSNSAWCQTLRFIQSILFVSRDWYNVAVTLLYQSICIRRFHQLGALRVTLCSTSSAHLALLVKSIAIECHVLERHDDLFIDHLQAILPRCSSLSTFAHNSAARTPKHAVQVPAHVTHLILNDHGLKFFSIVRELKHTLLSFHLTICELHSTSETIDMEKDSLPFLQSLSVTVTGSSKFQLLNALTHWAMPSLQRLTLALYCFSPPTRMLHKPEVESDILLFLVHCGGHLQQLQILLGDIVFRPQTFKSVLSSCPNLQRIILHPQTLHRNCWSNSDLADFFHPSLRHIDFTHLLWQLDTYDSSNLCLSKEYLPALESVRRFCNFPHELNQWLDDHPPTADTSTDCFVIDVFHHQLECVAGLYVWRFERDAVMDIDGGAYAGSFTVWSNSSDEDDEDYVSSSDDSNSSSYEVDEEWTTDDDDLHDL